MKSFSIKEIKNFEKIIVEDKKNNEKKNISHLNYLKNYEKEISLYSKDYFLNRFLLANINKKNIKNKNNFNLINKFYITLKNKNKLKLLKTKKTLNNYKIVDGFRQKIQRKNKNKINLRLLKLIKYLKHYKYNLINNFNTINSYKIKKFHLLKLYFIKKIINYSKYKYIKFNVYNNVLNKIFNINLFFYLRKKKLNISNYKLLQKYFNNLKEYNFELLNYKFNNKKIIFFMLNNKVKNINSYYQGQILPPALPFSFNRPVKGNKNGEIYFLKNLKRFIFSGTNEKIFIFNKKLIKNEKLSLLFIKILYRFIQYNIQINNFKGELNRFINILYSYIINNKSQQARPSLIKKNRGEGKKNYINNLLNLTLPLALPTKEKGLKETIDKLNIKNILLNKLLILSNSNNKYKTINNKMDLLLKIYYMYYLCVNKKLINNSTFLNKEEIFNKSYSISLKEEKNNLFNMKKLLYKNIIISNVGKYQAILYNFLNINRRLNSLESFDFIGSHEKKNISILLKYFFFKLFPALISKPVFIFNQNKIIIKLAIFFNKAKYIYPFYYKKFNLRKLINNKKRNLNFKGPLITNYNMLNSYFSENLKFNVNMKKNYWPFISLASLSFSNLFSFNRLENMRGWKSKKSNKGKKYNKSIFYSLENKFNALLFILENYFKLPVELEITRISNPIFDSNMIAQIFELNGKNSRYNRFYNIVKHIFQKIKIINPREHVKKINFIPINNLSLPSYVSGIKIKLAGRYYRSKIIPKRTVYTVQRGCISRSAVNFVEKSRYVGKSKRGSFTLTVYVSHIYK